LEEETEREEREEIPKGRAFSKQETSVERDLRRSLLSLEEGKK